MKVVQADMTKRLPFDDESFDIIFHPVSNCYIDKVEPIFHECYRVLKKGGIFLGGYDIGVNYIFDEKQEKLRMHCPSTLFRMKNFTAKASPVARASNFPTHCKSSLADSCKRDFA